MILLLSIVWASAAIALLVVVLRRFDSVERVDVNGRLDSAPFLSVIIPARNEAHNIERCLRSVGGQDYEPLEIVVVDDGSTDGTGHIARQIAAEPGMAAIRVIEAGPLPAGWVGKPHACWEGAKAARGDWLFFVDADTILFPGALSATMGEARRRDADMLSLFPFQELLSFWERVIFPTGFILLLLVLDFDRIHDAGKPEAAANGQLILVRRDVYEVVGGHQNEMVRSALVEDVALARAVKRSGYRLRLMRADTLARTRMYSSLPSLWEGFSKNVVELFSGPVVSVGLSAAALALGWSPVLLALAALTTPIQWLALGIVTVGLVAMLSIYFKVVHLLRIPFHYAFLFPLAYTMAAAIILNSARQRVVGAVPWKGRQYS